MNKIFFIFLLCFSTSVYAQEFNLDNYIPIKIPSNDPVEVVEPIVEENIFQPIEFIIEQESEEVVEEIEEESDLVSSFEEESKARFEEMKKIAEEMKKIAEEIREHNVMKITEEQSVEDDFSQSFANLEDRIAQLESRVNYLITEAEAVDLIKDEVNKQLEITIKSKEETKKETIPVTQNKTTGETSANYKLSPGEVITHINGVRVNIPSSAYRVTVPPTSGPRSIFNRR